MSDLQPNTTDDLNRYILAATIVFLSLSLASTVLLIIYARSRWARRDQMVDDPDTRGLDPGIVSSLPVRTFELDDEHRKCVVCLSDFVDGEKVKVLPDCGHGFHVDCVDTWFKSRSTCPLCRKPVREREPVIRVGSTRGYGEGLPVNVLFWGTREGGGVQVSNSGVKAGSPRCFRTEVDLEMGEVACPGNRI